MKASVGRLEGAKGRERIEMGNEPGVNYPFKDFGDEVEVGDRTIA